MALTHDPIDDLVSVTDPAGNLKTQFFDSLGRKIEIDDPNAGLWTFRYDDADNMVERTDARGARVVYTYDGAARPLTEDYFDAAGESYPGMSLGVRYHYDAGFCDVGDTACEDDIGGAQEHLRGQLAWVEDLTGASFFSYDARGRMQHRTREIAGAGRNFTTRMAYDGLDRETVVTYDDATTVTTSYNSRGLATSVSGFVDSVTYNAAGQRINVDHADDADTQREATYDARLRPDFSRADRGPGGVHLRRRRAAIDRARETRRYFLEAGEVAARPLTGSRRGPPQPVLWPQRASAADCHSPRAHQSRPRHTPAPTSRKRLDANAR